MSKKLWIRVSIIGVAILFIILFDLAIQLASFNDPMKTTPSPSPDARATEFYHSTVAFEHTAIAIFTQNPTLVGSSTPFYAEIIYNELIRNLTEIPYPIRGYYIAITPTSVSPTDLALTSTQTVLLQMGTSTPNLTSVTSMPYTITPAHRCVPTLSNWAMSDLSRELIDRLMQQGIKAAVNVVSVGIEGIDHACEIPFQAVRSQVYISVKVATLDNESQLNELATQIAEFLIDDWQKMEYVSKTAYISIYFRDSQGKSKVIATTYSILLQAYGENLQGEELVQALGGLVDAPDS